MEIYFIAIFTVECILKICAYGFFTRSDGYFRSVMNMVDFVIVMLGWVAIVVPLLTSSTKTNDAALDVKALRAFRVLRPLRVLSGVGSLQVVLNAIGRALVPLLHVALLVLLMLMTYAIIGVELFMGALQKTCFVNHSGMFDPLPHLSTLRLPDSLGTLLQGL